MEKTERRRRFLINLAYCAAILAVLVVLFRYMMSSLLPFFIAFIVAAVIHPLLDKLVKKCHLPHKFMGIVLIVLVYTLLAFLGIILCDKIAAFVQRMIVLAPRTWSGTLLPALRSIWESMTAFLARWDIEIDIAMDQVLATLDASIKTLSAKAVALVGNFAVSVPGKLVNTIICIVSTVFILLDWEAIGKFIHGQMPEKASEVMKDGWSQLKKTIGKYIRSYGLIMLMTFTELAIGLLIIGVDNSWGVAAGIAVLDILPIVGCGTVLIPWAVVSLVTGKTGLGISLLVLYVIIAIVFLTSLTAVPFRYFFQAISVQGFMSACLGGAIGEAIITRLFRFTVLKNTMLLGAGADGVNTLAQRLPVSQIVQAVGERAVMVSIKEIYGLLTIVAIACVMAGLLLKSDLRPHKPYFAGHAKARFS